MFNISISIARCVVIKFIIKYVMGNVSFRTDILVEIWRFSYLDF